MDNAYTQSNMAYLLLLWEFLPFRRKASNFLLALSAVVEEVASTSVVLFLVDTVAEFIAVVSMELWMSMLESSWLLVSQLALLAELAEGFLTGGLVER